jgi:hypothetical protein
VEGCALEWFMAIGAEEGSSGEALMTVKMVVGRGGKLKAEMGILRIFGK